jgi:hypothetical protein
MGIDPEVLLHKEWLGLLQPVGLVVSPLALAKSQATIDRSQAVELQQRLLAIVSTNAIPEHIKEGTAWIEDFPPFAGQVLDWQAEDLVGSPGQSPVPEELEMALPDYGEILRPTYAVPDPDSGQWLMLIQIVKPGLPLDEIEPEVEKRHGWRATVQSKFERLLSRAIAPKLG